MSRLELYYKIVSYISLVFTILLIAWTYTIWVKPFLSDKAKAWIVGVTYAAVMLVLGFMPFYINTILAFGAGSLAAFLVICRIDREYIAQKLFLTVTFFCLRWQAGRIVTSIGNECDWILYQIFPVADNLFWLWIFLIQVLLDALLSSLLIYGSVKCLFWSYGCRREYMNAKEFLLLVMPSISSVFAYGVIYYYNYVYQRDSGKSPFNLYGGYDLIMICYSAVCFVTIFVMTYMFRQWKTEQEEEKIKEVFSRQMADLESHISEVERLYRDMRMLQHDMKNHLMTLERLYQTGKYEAAEKYAGSLQVQMENVHTDIVSGNPVTDVILSTRKTEMQEKNIRFDCNFHFPQTGKVNAFDISIVLNNALSNAIEAIEREKTSSERKPYISLTSSRRKNMYIIEVTNSFTGSLNTDEVSGLPRTSKTGDGHGFGLLGIRRVAHKYLGDIEIRKEMYGNEERFILQVMLQIT